MNASDELLRLEEVVVGSSFSHFPSCFISLPLEVWIDISSGSSLDESCFAFELTFSGVVGLDLEVVGFVLVEWSTPLVGFFDPLESCNEEVGVVGPHRVEL